MAQIPNIADLTINPVEVSDLSQMIAEKVYQDPNYLKFNQTISGITKKTQILLDASSGKAGWKATGCAAIESGGMSIKMAELFWDLATIEDQLEICQSDLDSNFKALVTKYAADKFGDLSNQEAINVFVTAKVERFLKEAHERFVWLGDTDAENVADGGYVKDAINVKFYTALDGIWKQVFTNVGLGNTQRFTIAANAQATKALQMSTMDKDAAFAAIKNVYDNANDVIKLDPNAYIKVTSKVYNEYKNYLATNTLSGGGLSQITIEGVAQPAYMGVPIYTSLFESSEILSAFEISDGGSPEVLTYNLPHRVIMAAPELLPVATISDEDLNTLETFYVQKDRLSYIRFDFAVDTKAVRPELLSVGY
jgi:hypothetical protein